MLYRRDTENKWRGEKIKCHVLSQDIDGILGYILHSKFKELPRADFPSHSLLTLVFHVTLRSARLEAETRMMKKCKCFLGQTGILILSKTLFSTLTW